MDLRIHTPTLSLSLLLLPPFSFFLSFYSPTAKAQEENEPRVRDLLSHLISSLSIPFHLFSNFLFRLIVRSVWTPLPRNTQPLTEHQEQQQKHERGYYVRISAYYPFSSDLLYVSHGTVSVSDPKSLDSMLRHRQTTTTTDQSRLPHCCRVLLMIRLRKMTLHFFYLTDSNKIIIKYI